jgi:hypothetical protein
MKNIIKILFLSVVLLFQSCVENDTTFSTDADGVFYGDLIVDGYTDKHVGISVTQHPDHTVDIFFDNVKFATMMPVRIDITVKGVPANENEDILSFTALNIDPYVNKEPNPQSEYCFAEISGTVKGKELVLSARMADNLKPSRAGKKFSFRGTCK